MPSSYCYRAHAPQIPVRKSQVEMQIHAHVAEQGGGLVVLHGGAGGGAVQNLPQLRLACVEHDAHVLEAVDLQQPLHGVRVLLYVQDGVPQVAVLLGELVQAVVAVDLGQRRQISATILLSFRTPRNVRSSVHACGTHAGANAWLTQT